MPFAFSIYNDQTQDTEIRQDGYADILSKTFSGIRVSIGAQIAENAIQDTVEKYGKRTDKFNAKAVDKQFKTVLGVNPLRQEKWLKSKMAGFVENNVSLIKNITNQGIADMQTLVMTRVEAGDSTAKIAKAIQEKLNTTKSRARFIARDQVSKFNGKLTELRQKEAGVEEYIWRIADGDARDTHKANNGKTFRWDDPPETGHPGEDYG